MKVTVRIFAATALAIALLSSRAVAAEASASPGSDAVDYSKPSSWLCRPEHNEFATYLAIVVHGNPADPRVDDIKGDIRIDATTPGQYALHLDDMLLPMGNLMAIVKKQGGIHALSSGRK